MTQDNTNNKQKENIFWAYIKTPNGFLKAIALFITVIFYFMNKGKQGSYIVLICVFLILICLFLSFFSHQKNKTVINFFNGIVVGIVIMSCLIWILGFSRINFGPEYVPCSEEVCIKSLSWSNKLTQTMSVIQALLPSLETPSQIISIEPSVTPSFTNSNTTDIFVTDIPTITITPNPQSTQALTQTPTKLYGFDFCVIDGYRWALPINAEQRIDTEIGAIPKGTCVKFNGISSDGKWLRIPLNQGIIIVYPYPGQDYGWVLSEKLLEQEVRKDALPEYTLTPLP